MSTPSDIKAELDRLLKDLAIRTIPDEQLSEPTTPEANEEAIAIGNAKYESIEKSRERAEVEQILESNRDAKINRKLRWKYAGWVFCYLICYSTFVAILLILSGFNICGFKLDASVLDFLVGSTAAAVRYNRPHLVRMSSASRLYGKRSGVSQFHEFPAMIPAIRSCRVYPDGDFSQIETLRGCRTCEANQFRCRRDSGTVDRSFRRGERIRPRCEIQQSLGIFA